MNQVSGTDSKLRARMRAKQVGDLPHYPVENLYPCHLTEGIDWYVQPVHLLSVGIMVTLDGTITYAPSMVARMDIKSFRVWAQFDTMHDETEFQLVLRYYDKEERAHEQFGPPNTTGATDKFVFDIPLEHIDKTGWFTCALVVKLKTPMIGVEREVALARGQAEPMQPALIRGVWLEANG